MVQQGYNKARYSARASTRRRVGGSGEDAAYPAGRATVEAGLRSYALNKAEQLRFSRCTSDYREARNIVLGKWDADTSQFLTEEACLALAPPGKETIVSDAYRFLSRQGAINFGLLRGDPRVPLPPEVAERMPAAAADGATAAEPTDDDVAAKLFEIMASVDMNLTTEKMLRQRTGEALGVDLTQRKATVRQLVNDYLNSGGPPAWFKEKQREARRQAQREAARRRWRVVVVGAGPAGLTAALHLKRNGADVTVLEARDRVGGRVHSYKQDGFTAPVDLGASIITGTNPDVEKGLRSDPSAILCRQLGIRLHELGEQLPLLDTATGLPVPPELDAAVEKLRDELMDDVADLLDEMPEEQRNTVSYGEMLTKAVQGRVKAAEAAAAAQAAAAATAAAAAATDAAMLAAGAAVAAVNAASDAAATAVTAAAAAVAPEANGAAGVAPDPEVESVLDLLADPAPAPAPSLLGDDGLGLGPDLLLGTPRAAQAGKGEQEVVDEFLNSVLASPSPQKVAPVGPAPPPLPPPAAAAAAEVAAAVASGVAAVEPAIKTEAGADGADPAVKEEGAAAAPEGAQQEGGEEEVLPMTADQRRLLHWHWANLEYGCSARLEEISAPFWNQDEDAGGFGGPHCMVVGGYDGVFSAVAAALGDSLRLGTPVEEIRDEPGRQVQVVTASGDTLSCDAVIVTAPLGVLKAGTIRFVPELPAWKQEAINRLGFGDLNKVVLEFPSVFWNDEVDYFGAAGEPTEEGRGRCFMWWNFHRFSGASTLAALVSGVAARAAEEQPPEELKDAALAVLRRIHPGVDVPEPTAFTASKWGSEPYSRGSYSFVAVGASGQHYDTLAQPVGRRLLFAGEHTAREHPDTVGGAMLSGLREAARVLDMAADEEAEAEEEGVGAREEREAPRELSRDASAGRKRKGSAQQEAAPPRGRQPEGEAEEEEDDDDDDWGDARPAKIARERGSQIKRQRSSSRQEMSEPTETGAAAIWHWIRQSDIGKDMDWDDDDEMERSKQRDAAGKKKKKRGRDDEVASEDDLERNMEREYAAAIGKEREYVSAEQRQAQRDSAKAVVRALLLSSAGDMDALRQLLHKTESLQDRVFMLNNLRTSADKPALARIAADNECALVLSGWLEAAAAEAHEVSLVEALLRLLRLLPFGQLVLDKSGLLRVLRTRCVTHSEPDCRKLAQDLSRSWSASEAAAAGAGAAGNGAARPSSAGGSRPALQRVPQPQPQRRDEEEDLSAYIDEQRAAELAALQQQAAAAAAAAAALKAEIAAAQQGAQGQAPQKFELKSFQDYRSEQKGAQRKPLTKLERVPKQPRSSGAGASGSGRQDPITVEAVKTYVGKVLQPFYTSNELDKKQFKDIQARAVRKVMERESSTGGNEFLTSSKRAQIKELVLKYVQLQKK